LTPNFPDYPKYGVWPDGYYVTTNEASPTQYVFDRENMLLGLPARPTQRFTAPNLAGFGFQAMTPADLDGTTAPPTDSPNYILRHRDDEAHNPGANDPAQDFLEVWEFSSDFDTPSNASFAQVADIPISEIDSELCGFFSFFCFPQPGTTTTLDPIREVIMHRLQYRNFGTHETLVGNMVTDVDGTDHGGVRWFELRKTGGSPWTLFQEGTIAPDDDHRWMGGIAMDGDGNIAVGYNVSSSTTPPSLAYSGRLAADPLGTMPIGETTIVTGVGNIGSNRFGDYSAMSIDPVDDQTFWFTGEYADDGQWATRISSFSFAPPPPSLAQLTFLDRDGNPTTAINERDGMRAARGVITVNGLEGRDTRSVWGDANSAPITFTVQVTDAGGLDAAGDEVDIYGGNTSNVFQVIMPAGSSSVEFDIDALDDLLLDGDQAIDFLVTPSDLRVGNTSNTLTVTDNPPPARGLLIEVIDASGADVEAIDEGAAAEVRVTRTGDLSLPLTITVVGSAEVELNGGAPAVLSFNANEATTTTTIPILGLVDGLADGTRTVIVDVDRSSAELNGYDITTDQLDIVDLDVAQLTVSILGATSFAENDGAGASMGRVTRNTPNDEPLVVTLMSNGRSLHRRGDHRNCLGAPDGSGSCQRRIGGQC
jgi:hypothetical protein